VKCRPPDNRDPEPDEVAACLPYLRRQLEILDPALIVTLGRHSMGRFIRGARIGQVHGTLHAVDPATGAGSAMVYAMFHPAAALRSPDVERQSYDDAAGIPAALIEARGRRTRPDPTPDPSADAGVEALVPAAVGPVTSTTAAAATAAPPPATQPPEREPADPALDAPTLF